MLQWRKESQIVSNSNIYNLICIFNSISKYIGFTVIKSDDTFFIKFLREFFFLWLVLFALLCTIFAELWCIKFLGMGLDVRKVVIFCITQILNFLPLGCLLYFRSCDVSIWKIILKIKRLEENLIICNIYLETGRIGWCGLIFWFFQFFIIMGMMYYALWPTMMFFLLDSICMFYFEAWVTIPYLQFLVWIWFLSFVSYRVQLKIIEINQLEYLKKPDLCRIENRLTRVSWDGCGLDRMNQIKTIIVVLKQVLSIASELSAAYGITVLIYIVSYVSKVILQFYDLLDKDAQKFSVPVGIVVAFIRIIFVLPGFVFCEQLSFNVNKAIELIQEIAILRQPSCLDCIFQSLTLRSRHQSTATKICGFLNITYSSLLKIMTTALAFLLFQLQI